MRSWRHPFALAVAFAFLHYGNSQILSIESTPTAYHLKIDASTLTTSDTFSGAVLMNMTIESTIPALLVHAENLTINQSSLVILKRYFKTMRWDNVNITSLSENQTMLNISFAAPLSIGDYSLYIEYIGYYQSSMTGFAKVGYHYRNEQKYLGVTALEPTNARKVFPCFDTPGYKTPFTVEITVNRPHIAISNVRPTSVHSISNTARVFLFTTYSVIPAHQLAWAVVDQSSYSVREDNSTSTFIHTRAPHLYLNQTAWANKLSAHLVQAVGNYTGVPFDQTTTQSYSKIEQIVLPEFFVGTSEGFSFMSFSEESILVSPGKSSSRYTQDVALALARGVVQQWFGYIISINSWNNIWIMKGLDQFLQYIITESLPDTSLWELRDQAAVELTQVAFGLDSFNSHPLTVLSDNETHLVNTVFDSLTKYKGGAIIRMLEDVFGSSFKEAMSMLIQNSYSGNTPITPTDFWNILYTVAADKNVDLAQQSLEDLMQQWISSPGYPVLSVASNSSHFIISQHNTSLWWVPVSYTIQGSSSVGKVWLQPGSYFTLPASSANWILLNLNQTGFYRVNYTSELWQVLSRQLRTDLNQLPRLSRAQLVDDAFSMDPAMALELTGFLRSETDYFPWATALRHYQNLTYLVAGHSSYELLQSYVLYLMESVIEEVGYLPKQQDTHVDRLKRSLVLEKACQFGHQGCIQKAVSNLRFWMAQTYYDADLSPALLCAGVANSSADVWHNVWSMYQYSVYPSVRLALLQSLTCTYNKDLLYQFLNNVTSTSVPIVSVKDKTIILQTLSSKPYGAHILLNWLVDRLKAQANSSSNETTTPVSTSTQEPPSSPNTTTPSLNQTTDPPIVARLASITVPESAMPTENLTESDITTILNLVTPMLTTLEEGTMLDYFLALGNATGLSSATLEAMKNTTQRIYVQSDKVMKLNAKLTSWLEAEAAATTSSSSGGSTKPSTQTIPSSTPAPSPSGTSQSTFTTALLLLAIYMHISHMQLHA